MMIKVFAGYDSRQPVAYTVLQHSIIVNSSQPVSMTPLILKQLAPFTRRGLTEFTFSRFLVPWLSEWKGYALFVDADIVVIDDVAKLIDMAKADPGKAVYVRKGPLRFEWASVMLFDCAHYANRVLTPEYLETADKLHTIGWLDEKLVGALPDSWNVLIGYDDVQPGAEVSLAHFTQGIPVWEETQGSDCEVHWQRCAEEAFSAKSWREIMGPSVHAKPVIQRLIKQGKIRSTPELEKALAS